MLVMKASHFKEVQKRLFLYTLTIIALLGFIVLNFYGVLAYSVFITASCILSYKSGKDIAKDFITVYRIDKGLLYVVCKQAIIVVDGIKVKKKKGNKLYISYTRVLTSNKRVTKKYIVINTKAYEDKMLEEFFNRLDYKQ